MNSTKYFIGKRRYNPRFLDRRVYGIFSLAGENTNFIIDTSVSDDAVAALGNDGYLFKAIRQTVSRKSGKTLTIVVPVENVEDINSDERNYSFLNAVDCILTGNDDERYFVLYGQDVATKRFIKKYKVTIQKAVQDDIVNVHDLFQHHQESPEFHFNTAKLVISGLHVEAEMATEPAYSEKEYAYQCIDHRGYPIWDEESESMVLLSAEEIVKHWSCFKDAPDCIAPKAQNGRLFLSIDKKKAEGRAKMMSGFGSLSDFSFANPVKLSFGNAFFFLPNNKLKDFASIISNIEIVGNYALPAHADWRFDASRRPGTDRTFAAGDKTYISFDGFGANSLYLPVTLMAKKYSGNCANATIHFSGNTIDTLRIIATFKG